MPHQLRLEIMKSKIYSKYSIYKNADKKHNIDNNKVDRVEYSVDDLNFKQTKSQLS